MATEGQKRYREYLTSDHWQHLKEQKSKQKRKTCPGCTLRKPLQLHHMLYRGDPLNTVKKDLMWLCGDCHKLWHEVVGLQVPPELRKNRGWLKAYTKRVIRAELWRRGQWRFPTAPSTRTDTGAAAEEFVVARAKGKKNKL